MPKISLKESQIDIFEAKAASKARKRAKKTGPQMKVSGKSVFKLQSIIKRKAKK